MSYLEKNRWGETYVSISRFSADLAPLLGGEFIPADKDMGPEYVWGRIKIGDAIIIVSKGKAHGRLSLLLRHDNKLPYGRQPSLKNAEFALPEISIDPERPMDKLVSDIKRRLVDPAQPILANWRAFVSASDDEANQLEKSVARILEAIPSASINIRDDKTSATFYLNAGGTYLTGDIYSDGHLSVQRCGTIPAGRLVAVVNALMGNG